MPNENYLPLAGGHMTGPIELYADAQSDFEPVTRRQLTRGVDPEESTDPEVEDGVQPTVTLSIRGAIRSAVVVWTALEGVHGNGYYEVEVDTSINFDSGNLQSGQTKGLIMGFDDLVPGAVYYCRLRARNADGVLSGWSTVANTTLGKAGGVDIDAGSIQAAHAVFDVAAIVDADIADLNVGKLTGGQLSVTEFIESDGFLTGTAGFHIDGDGSAEFNDVTVRGDIQGSTITGSTFKTAVSGDRIEMSSDVFDRIQFFFGSGSSYIRMTSNGITVFAEDDTGVAGTVRVSNNLTVGVDCHVSGDFTVTGSKNFVVPHPTDSTKNVVHASYEGPGPGGTIYRYRVSTLLGQAEVSLPDYFDGINRDVDVHVSPVGHFGRAYGEVSGSTLKVFADADGEYAVLVLGTRDDAHAQKWQPGDDVQDASSEDGSG